jgi:hypothetical protein
MRQKQSRSKNKRVKIDRKLISSHDFNGLTPQSINNFDGMQQQPTLNIGGHSGMTSTIISNGPETGMSRQIKTSQFKQRPGRNQANFIMSHDFTGLKDSLSSVNN